MTIPEEKNNKYADTLSSYISAAEKRLSEQIKKQFSFMVFATLLPTIVLVFAFGILPYFLREPTNESLIIALQESNAQISELSKTLLLANPADKALVDNALELVLKQSNLHQQAIETIKDSQNQVAPEAQSIIQVIGSAAILALLGALGLQRLQNIDTEINNLRESIFTQSEARAQMIKEALGSQIDDEIQKQFIKRQEDIQLLLEKGKDTLSQIQTSTTRVQQAVSDETERLRKELSDVRDLINRYPWLTSKDTYKSVSTIQRLASIEEAQTLAEKLRRAGDLIGATEALKSAIAQNLLGGYADFHNAFSEAMRLKNPQLGLEIVERGLACFPDDPDLIANKVKALYSLGRPLEAKEFIERWRTDKPQQFIRSWRPVVFYEDLFDGIELTEQDFLNLKSAFEEVSQKLPYEIKVWAEYADLMIKHGDIETAESIFKTGLQLNPLSQQLNFMLGDLLLKQGKSTEAVKYLEKALSVDYQDQYQHDVNQMAIRARLAQAYEAVENLEKATLLYKSIVVDPQVSATIQDYAKNRLSAIALQQNKLPDESEKENTSAEQLLDILQKLGSAIDNTESE